MADKYYRLVSFLVNICPQQLRELFLKYMNSDPTRAPTCTTLSAYLASKKPQLLILKKRKVIRQSQWQLLFPRTGQADESSFDTSLVVLLLDEFFKMQLQPLEVDAMQDIRDIRNRLQHMAETSIADADFDGMWNILENATIDLAKQINPSPAYVDTIKEYIDDTKINNMPKLGDSLRYWYEHIIMQLQSEIDDMKEIIMEVSEHTADNVKYTKECRTILLGSSVKKVGPSGDKVKRMKTVDQILAKLNNFFLTTMKDDLPATFDCPPEVADIKTKLRDVHHVVVTGYRGSRYLETALVAIKDMGYNDSRCVEMRGSSDWRHIDPDEVDFVLCREPFGDYTFDESRTKSMVDIFNNMLRTANASDGSKYLDILIVSEIDVLQRVSNLHDHGLLEEVIKVYQPTTEKDPADLTYTCMEFHANPTCTENLLGFTTAFMELYTDETFHSETVIHEAKAGLKRNKVIVLTGPRHCGKTTLAVTLASKYQRNQFLILNKPDDLKHVSLNSICMVLVEDFAGKHRYDAASTCAWLKEFEMLYSAVRAGKLNVIITCEETTFQQCQKDFGLHALLQNTNIKLKSMDRKVKMESSCSLNLNNDNESSDIEVSQRYGHTDLTHLEANVDKNAQESEETSKKVHSSEGFVNIKGMSSLNENTFLCLNAPNTVLRLNSNLDVEKTDIIQEQNAEKICRMNDEKFVIVSEKQLSVYKLEGDNIQHLQKETLDHECDCIAAGKDGNIAILNGNHVFEYDDNLSLTDKTQLPMKSINDSYVVGATLLCDSKCVVILKQHYVQSVTYKSTTPMKRCLYLEEGRLMPIAICPREEDVFILCYQSDGQTKVIQLGLDLVKRGQFLLGDVPYTTLTITSILFDSQMSRLLVTYCGKLDEFTCFHQLTHTKEKKSETNQLTTAFTRVKNETFDIIDEHYAVTIYCFCQTPDRSFMFLQGDTDDHSKTLEIHHVNSDFRNRRTYNTDITFNPYYSSCDICCTDSGDVLLVFDGEIMLYRIRDRTIQKIRSTKLHDIGTETRVSFFKNRIFLFCRYSSTTCYVMDTFLNVKKKIELFECIAHDDNMFEIVPCVMQKFFFFDEYANVIICNDPKKKQIKYLKEKDFEPRCICAASEDSVFVLGRQLPGEWRILQVNTDMEIISDIPLKEWIKYIDSESKMVFDKVNARLVFRDRFSHAVEHIYLD